ncbi:MAG: bifunctional metallophosphatase/5'-nucleotidase [Muribaculaceae bacterium]|nr:bifunctional metallophosphatase/5'-nucleotidase [Muribaculaceae bacterium]
MHKILLTIILILNVAFLNASSSNTTQVTIKIIETTDVHGNIFPFDFINQKSWDGSLAQVFSYVEKQRKETGDENVLLIDNGDILQGQPTVYYYNFMDTTSTHIVAELMNFMKYDVATIGNHDIETGHPVYDRWVAECNFPILGANIIDTKSGTPYFKPYTILNRKGIKIAILGLITPAVPSWLPENLWSGMKFEDMVTSAKKWVPYIQKHENPDLLIGLFHSGSNSKYSTSGFDENASAVVADEVHGFDIIFMGHDHLRFCDIVKNANGQEVHLVNPANNAHSVGEVDITFTLSDGKVVDKKLQSKITSVSKEQPTTEFNNHFAQHKKIIMDFVSRKIGYSDKTITTRDAYFGPSAFIDFIHQLQLDISNADISFAAPLSFNATIKKGDILMSDMFNLYKFENMLYAMNLSGKEIKDYLEMSYDLWINTIASSNEHLLKIEESENGKTKFKNPTYNFDSAAGLLYTIDVTKEKGNRITISSLANGEPFDTSKTYLVAINSYRGNGGGNLLTKGAGIPNEELPKRIVWATDIDLRYHLMKQIEKAGTISPSPLNQWRFIPEEIAVPAASRDRHLLFPDE